MHRCLRALLRLCAPALITLVASVQDSRAKNATFTLGTTMTFERDGDILDATESDQQRSQLVWSLRSGLTLAYRKRFENGQVLSVGQSIEGDLVPGHSSLNRLEWKTTGQYQFAIDGARNWQLRLQGEYTHNRRHDMEVFDRIRAGVLLRYRHDPKHLTRARLRLGYREQNDALFAGFDQAEYLLEVGHDWRPKADRTNLSVTAYKELRRAEAAKYSYDEIGLRLAYRHPASKNFEVTGRVSGFIRDYDDAFSATAPTRNDRRLQAQIEGAYKLSDTTSVIGYVGWESNHSNIAERDYSGPVAGIQFKINLGRWK